MSDFKLKTRKLENENIRQTLAGCFVFCCLLFIGCFFHRLFFAQCLLTFVTHNSYLFCFLIIELSTLFFFLLWMKMTMRMRWIFLFVCFAYVCEYVCGEKGGNNHDATKKWSFVCIGECFAALNLFFFSLVDNSSNSVWGCVWEWIQCNCSSIGEMSGSHGARERPNERCLIDQARERQTWRGSLFICSSFVFFCPPFCFFFFSFGSSLSRVWAENLSSLNSFSYSVYF